MNNLRDNTQLRFIQGMEDLVIFGYKHSAKFPRRYGNNYTNRLLMNLTYAQEYLQKANNINIDYKYWKYGKTDATYEMNRKSFEAREDLLKESISSLKQVSKFIKIGIGMEIEILIKDDNLVAKSFLAKIVNEVKLIEGLMKSDSRAFKRFSIAMGKDFSTY